MAGEKSSLKQMTSLVKDAYAAFAEFMRDLMSIKKAEKDIITEAHRRVDAKKLAIIKSKINSID